MRQRKNYTHGSTKKKNNLMPRHCTDSSPASGSSTSLWRPSCHPNLVGPNGEVRPEHEPVMYYPAETEHVDEHALFQHESTKYKFNTAFSTHCP
jgi:hypothetical protein